MTNSTKDEGGAHDAEPTTHAEPQDDTSALLELTSLRSYFDDPNRKDARSPFSDWLRAKAHQILDDKAGKPVDLFRFGKSWLNEMLLFGPAANVFALALEKSEDATSPLSNKIRQQQALATYKDEETPPRRRYQAALAILKLVKPLSQGAGTKPDEILADQAETWGLRGAVHRRLFDLDGDLTQLHQALDCYREAHSCDDRRDTVRFEGYGGINAAFLLDSLAFRLESIGEGPILKHAAQDARAESASLRKLIIDRLRERFRSEEEQKHEWLAARRDAVSGPSRKNEPRKNEKISGVGACVYCNFMRCGTKTKKILASACPYWGGGYRSGRLSPAPEWLCFLTTVVRRG